MHTHAYIHVYIARTFSLYTQYTYTCTHTHTYAYTPGPSRAIVGTSVAVRAVPVAPANFAAYTVIMHGADKRHVMVAGGEAAL